MTNKEAIKVLTTNKEYKFNIEFEEALKTALKALRNQEEDNKYC